jgi:hypothetical protein
MSHESNVIIAPKHEKTTRSCRREANRYFHLSKSMKSALFGHSYPTVVAVRNGESSFQLASLVYSMNF